MVVGFFGHADFVGDAALEKMLFDLLEKEVGENVAEFFLGEHGGFDRFAYRCAVKYQKKHPNTKLALVTPCAFAPKRGETKDFTLKQYDLIIDPGLEGVPPRFLVARRNRWTVQKADLIFFYVARGYGGAFSAYQYAKRLGKKLYNLTESGIF